MHRLALHASRSQLEQLIFRVGEKVLGQAKGQMEYFLATQHTLLSMGPLKMILHL